MSNLSRSHAANLSSDSCGMAASTHAILERDDRTLALVLDEIVDRDSHDEFIAESARVFEQVKMPDMEQIVDSGGVADYH